jgi:hypothetical protein
MALTERTEIEARPWSAFEPWFRKAWRPGEHVALIGPTGTGKTTLAVSILPMRRYVLALDPKGGDSTLERLARRGFQRVNTWPPPRSVWRDIEEGKPARLIVGAPVRERKDFPKLRRTMAAALDDAFDQRGWTIYVDELRIAADPQMMNLASSIERNLIAARDRGVSMVTSFQAPRWVPKSASDQTAWVFAWYTRDTDVVDRMAEMVGRRKAEIRGAVRGIGSAPHGSVLVFGRDPRLPLIVTRPPKA